MRQWCALTIACCLLARAEDPAKTAPSYSETGVVNAASFVPGALAPNCLATIFGSDLSFRKMDAGSVSLAHGLPLELAGVAVVVAGLPAQLFYVSETQINFLIPSALRPGEVKLRVSRQGVHGPEVPITLAESAPSLFRKESDYVIATHADGSVITSEAPARPGEIVVLYAAGLGRTEPAVPDRELPVVPSPIRALQEFRLTFGGVAVDAARVLYAGITPRSAGLYQVNVALPDTLSPDPDVRIAIGDRSSVAGLKLAVR